MSVNSVGTTSYSSTYDATSASTSRAKSLWGNQSTTETSSETTEIRRNSELPCHYAYDPVEVAEQGLYNRKMVTSEINELFEENGIEIPEGTTLTFTIDPYDCNLTVSGTDDEDLTSKIESVLNSGSNSQNLWLHICDSSSGDYIESSQMTSEKQKKFEAWDEVLANTGIDLRDCTNKDGTFYTSDGVDVIELYMNNTTIPSEYQSSVTSYYEPILRELAEEGFDSSDDLVLSIDYKDGSLYDVGQTNGFGEGQTVWIDDLISEYGDSLYTGNNSEDSTSASGTGTYSSDKLLQAKTSSETDSPSAASYNLFSSFLSFLGMDDKFTSEFLNTIDSDYSKSIFYYLSKSTEHNSLDTYT
jgi:hypothetical protein